MIAVCMITLHEADDTEEVLCSLTDQQHSGVQTNLYRVIQKQIDCLIAFNWSRININSIIYNENNSE